MVAAAQVQSGPPIDPLTRILLYPSGEWEKFIDEWVSSLKKKYLKVLRFTGSGDKGIDVAGFADDQFLNGVWDNYQCKHYDKPIPAIVAWPEIGKILWYSFNKHYTPPRAYYFVAPRETSTTLTQLLSNTPIAARKGRRTLASLFWIRRFCLTVSRKVLQMIYEVRT